MYSCGRSGGSLRFKKSPGAIFIHYIHVVHPPGHQHTTLMFKIDPVNFSHERSEPEG